MRRLRTRVDPYFLTSTPVDHDWAWVQRFHTDLQRELRFHVGADVGGIIDDSPPGNVGRVPALVAVVSDRYFMDRRCGLHWSVFSARILLDEARRPGAADHCLIPVLWQPMQLPPPPGIRLPSTWMHDHPAPTEVGLRELMRTRRQRSDDPYVLALRKLVEQITLARRRGLARWPDVTIGGISPSFGPIDGPGELGMVGGVAGGRR